MSAKSDGSPTGRALREEEDSQGLLLEEDLVSLSKDTEDNATATTEKSAHGEPVADFLLAQQTKCDRINPCSQCIKTGSQCTYKLGQTVKTKRQRILISSL
ncbi:Zn(II)2Cys6 transcription factor domain-containing protein [Aspergillus udagawae]|uniref:Zn(2)-C6 fungal-type domain-containing protein n=1 Tax=Aspergillus udagawae TaxID=91492 RepID=A0A8E0V667_9EURO|nr:uncharacterized protein Aud_001843 [Aspergillus udagawae]GIC94514.1 hypothetical protein Aud_001843 [Aspergillus udagawae]